MTRKGEALLYRPLLLESDAFVPAGKAGLFLLDMRCTSWGDSSSPDLRWSGGPEAVGSFALVLEASLDGVFTFCHWVLYNIPPFLRHLPPGIPPQESLPNGICQGIHSGGRLGYLAPALSPPALSPKTRGAKAPTASPRFAGETELCLRFLALQSAPELPSRLNREGLLEWAGRRPEAGGGLAVGSVWLRLPEVPERAEDRSKEGRVA